MVAGLLVIIHVICVHQSSGYGHWSIIPFAMMWGLEFKMNYTTLMVSCTHWEVMRAMAFSLPPHHPPVHLASKNT
ncbi:hypothetical protein FRX31_026368 [Thalictrum thalictroides]|uniref:Secreted protein n=1 Tax=Thalictrum thalictroides TaxID=46969 RepID=A0A7J6VHI2_THATH|nr:hypothetical protein FRX31_026368 [Thalictrum thalictroides]